MEGCHAAGDSTPQAASLFYSHRCQNGQTSLRQPDRLASSPPTPENVGMKVLRRVIPLLMVVVGLLALVQAIAGRPTGDISTPRRLADRFEAKQTAGRLDEWFQGRWTREQITPAAAAHEATVLRRLSLALHGTVPSLEELRQFEADAKKRRLERWTQRLLDDSRFATYFSERLGRALVGAEEGPFLAFRRDRFHAWLSEQLAANRPWDRIVTRLVTAQGLPTGEPATNFITIAQVDEEIDEQVLAGRTIRAFLGQRIDCAQCHDHFFDPRWKQAHFEGLAAFYAPVRFSPLGVDDNLAVQFEVTDHKSGTSRVVEPRVPFGSEWLPSEGTPRRRLAQWLTDRRNLRFDRAIVNRVWGQMFGRPYSSPVDDLPDPGDPATAALDLLSEDFRSHNRELKWLIHAIAASRPFRLDSRPHVPHDSQTLELPLEELRRHEEAWAVFPVLRLRPEQVIGAMLQTASIKTIDRHSHLFTRARRFFSEQSFVQDYGDLGDEELSEQTGTIPQALLRMNGQLARELIKPGVFGATTAIARATQGDDRLCLRTCFEVCLGRQPSDHEQEVMGQWLADTRGRRRELAVEDIFWTLFNSPEFSWNH